MAHVNPSIFQSALERRLRDELLAGEDTQRALRHVDRVPGRFGAVARQRQLLSNAFKLTRPVAPRVLDALAACKELLGHEGPVDVFIHPEPMIRAAAVYAPPDTPAIVLSSRLLEVFQEAELRFILGHELGHLAFEHFTLPLPAMALASDWDEESGRLVSPATALGLYRWNRAAEASADRAGLLCARELEASASVLLARVSGWTAGSVKSELQAAERHVDALLSDPSARQRRSEDEEALGGFRAHAFSPWRVRALVAFSKTRTFLRSAGRYASEEGLSDEEADTLLAWELRELDPSYLGKSEHPELLQLALTTGKLLPVLEQLYQERAALSERARLVQHFTLLKAPDGVVDNLGYLELKQIAGALTVPSWLVDEALRGASNPLD
ncbi:peptidase M48-like protein [Archangium gephyra]|uniref:Peptidase M48-like protein n=1 Tax=Archangium gephyra TaxID=48 RepID=A0AAC8QAZ3_9BACT|nr:M48 family metallopeptidase [Archangium gephyra]AKJ04004.1 Zn-dependent protease with chaperone function [Archangium gephyra]REG37910.1 peptidase M48-like protein [Archangium gephyra]